MRSGSDLIGEDPNTSGGKEKAGKRDGGSGTGALYVVGIGPGRADHLSQRAKDVLAASDEIVGYKMYVDLIRPLFPDKPYYTSAMKKEIDRVNYAVETALGGSRLCLVCSGDPGVYALAGLVFEICRSKSVRLPGPGAESSGNKEIDLNLEIVPGIPALSSCASLAGAPLTHDFAAISLSDLLTPWEVIERRIEAAAFADFVIVLYNPKSKKRDWQLKKAVDIVLKHRDPKTPVGVVGRAMREGQRITATTLEDIDIESVDMQSTVFIGNCTTFTFEGYMVTPRGYTDKYGLPQDALSKETPDL